jgi:hypothetical protein
VRIPEKEDAMCYGYESSARWRREAEERRRRFLIDHQERQARESDQRRREEVRAAQDRELRDLEKAASREKPGVWTR